MERDNKRPVAIAVLDRSGDRDPTLRDLVILAAAAGAAIVYVSYLSFRDFVLW